jgi:hypothetical protein
MKTLLLLALTTLVCNAQPYSQLWGKNGKNWSPQSRLPDFSFAGYHSGEAPLPQIPVVSNVRNFGAKGDGQHDDTAAFVQAIKSTESGAILIPTGRYIISDILWIKKPNIVLRGEGSNKTILVFPKTLEDVRPNMSSTTSGRPTSGYSWSGGFIWVKGDLEQRTLCPILGSAKRGDHFLTLEKTNKLKVGQRVCIELHDTPEKTLINHLYTGDPGDTAKITKPIRLRFVSRIETIEGNQIKLPRPMRTDIRPEWKPVLKTYQPTVY